MALVHYLQSQQVDLPGAMDAPGEKFSGCIASGRIGLLSAKLLCLLLCSNLGPVENIVHDVSPWPGLLKDKLEVLGLRFGSHYKTLFK